MRDLTLILPHFCNHGMLAEQQRVWADYPADLKSQLHVIVVDDNSPKGARLSPKLIQPTGVASVRLYRIGGQKRRWNWLACRNLGVNQASTEWVLLTDIDHVLPAETLTRLLTGPLDARDVYRFARADAPHVWPYRLAACADYKPHPNTWLMTGEMFDRIGGYDERLSGCYGTDGEFRDRVQQTARAVVSLPAPMVRYPREIIADASTTVFTRKGDPVNDEDLKQRREARARIKNWRPLRLTFPWERVA
jgi:hypothetical protein